MTRTLYQTDSYLTTLDTDVVECRPADGGHEVALAETILYPEGGGQPSDRGTIDGQEVRASRKDDRGKVVHHVDQPVSGRVTVELDWPTRFDYMQQHTAQHMITALAVKHFDLATMVFHLGESRSDIEFDSAKIPQDRIDALEALVNELIRAARPITARVVDADQYASLPVRSRRLPDGFSGPTRLVDIEGVDLNTCGGTHVANTAEIQSVKLLHTEHLRGGTRVFFLAGGRVHRMMDRLLDRERAITGLLTCSPRDHAASVEKLIAAAKEHERAQRRRLREECKALAAELAAKPGVVDHHAPDGDMDYLRTLASAARDINLDFTALLTAGKDEGVFMLSGSVDLIKERGPGIANLLGGRGGGRDGLFQGKYTTLDRRAEALGLLVD